MLASGMLKFSEAVFFLILKVLYSVCQGGSLQEEFEASELECSLSLSASSSRPILHQQALPDPQHIECGWLKDKI